LLFRLWKEDRRQSVREEKEDGRQTRRASLAASPNGSGRSVVRVPTSVYTAYVHRIANICEKKIPFEIVKKERFVLVWTNWKSKSYESSIGCRRF
jgi:hypothetical protein